MNDEHVSMTQTVISTSIMLHYVFVNTLFSSIYCSIDKLFVNISYAQFKYTLG